MTRLNAKQNENATGNDDDKAKDRAKSTQKTKLKTCAKTRAAASRSKIVVVCGVVCHKKLCPLLWSLLCALLFHGMCVMTFQMFATVFVCVSSCARLHIYDYQYYQYD